MQKKKENIKKEKKKKENDKEKKKKEKRRRKKEKVKNCIFQQKDSVHGNSLKFVQQLSWIITYLLAFVYLCGFYLCNYCFIRWKHTALLGLKKMEAIDMRQCSGNPWFAAAVHYRTAKTSETRSYTGLRIKWLRKMNSIYAKHAFLWRLLRKRQWNLSARNHFTKPVMDVWYINRWKKIYHIQHASSSKRNTNIQIPNKIQFEGVGNRIVRSGVWSLERARS